jgi:hypothetical protein
MKPFYIAIFLCSLAVAAMAWGCYHSTPRVFAAEDDKPCHADEEQVTDGNGGSKCVRRATEEELVHWPAKDCIRDFNVSDKTELVAPMGWNHKPDLSKARLEGFEFRLVCGTAK